MPAAGLGGGSFGGAYSGLGAARPRGTAAGLGWTTPPRQGIAGTVDPARQRPGDIGPGYQGPVHNPAYGSNTQETQVVARPDGTYVQLQRSWDPRTGSYSQDYAKEGGRHQKTTVTSRGGPWQGDLSASDFRLAQRYLPKIPPREHKPDQASRVAAEAAAYGRAKDQIGLNAAAGLKAMQGLMASRGISGSGIEAALSQGVVSDALGGLGEVSRDQAIQGLQRDYAVEDRNLAADVTQRGQDVSALSGRNADIMRLMDLTRKSHRGEPARQTTERWAY